MRKLILGILWFFLSLAIAAQAPTPQPARPAAQDGGVREVLESIVIPPIPNQPILATPQTEWIRYTGEGGTITLVNERPTRAPRTNQNPHIHTPASQRGCL